LLILYLELESSDRGDSSWTSSVISLYFIVKSSNFLVIHVESYT
jgi:hypothetical protein